MDIFVIERVVDEHVTNMFWTTDQTKAAETCRRANEEWTAMRERFPIPTFPIDPRWDDDTFWTNAREYDAREEQIMSCRRDCLTVDPGIPVHDGHVVHYRYERVSEL